MKICSKCDEEKSLDQFNADSRRKDGKRASCKTCDATQKKAIRDRNLAEYRQRNAEANRKYRKRIKEDVEEIISDQGKYSDGPKS